MIHCADCGTLNRRGSSFCSSCGHDLHAAPDITCAECNRISPPDSAFCQWCGAPLAGVPNAEGVTSSPTPALSQPTPTERPMPPHRRLPQWLYESHAAQAGLPAAEASTAPPKPPQPHVKSKYLDGIENALPATDAWQSAARGTAVDGTDSPAGRGRESRRRFGCLALGVTVLLRVVALGAEKAL
jgi:hypothetical protein